MFKITGFLAILFLSITSQAQYSGRYTDGKDYAVYFQQTPHGLTIRPVMWTATQVLRPTVKDKFEVVDRASRGAEFERDAQNRVTGVRVIGMDGEGLTLRRAAGPMLPIEMLLADRPLEAAEAYAARGGLRIAIETAGQVLLRLPTKTQTVVRFLDAIAPSITGDIRFENLRGFAFVQAGDRRRAVESFRRAYAIDPKNIETISALARLNSLPASEMRDDGWKIPFSLDSVFAKPTIAEIAAVEKDWSTRDLLPKGVREELKSTVMIADRRFDVRIVSHLVHDKRHFGAIISPTNATPGCCPVIIEAKGVSPTYFPLNLERLAAPRFMGDAAGKFVYVVPSFRGEVLNFDGKTFTSEGDRTDALDGATDDAIALLNVALQTTPGIDGSRVCAFGHSRGGTVAMLTGIRDKRVDCVVNWAGPTDWFYAMGTNGWTEQELWGEALRTRANTQQTGGQNVERFLKRAIDGHADLGEVRHRMIASSPLYFAHRLPKSQHHYGMEDPSVPIRNARDLVAKLGPQRLRSKMHHTFFYPGEGHDTDRILAPISSRQFILDALKVGK